MKGLLRAGCLLLAVVAFVDWNPYSPPWVIHTAAAQSVNQVIPVPAATGTGPALSATGPDTNIDITLTPKGSGALNMFGAASAVVVGPYAASGAQNSQPSGFSSNIIKKLKMLSLSVVAPASTTFAGLSASASGYFSATYIVPGLAVTDSVFIDSGAVSANTPCKPVSARVSAANSLLVWYAKVTLAACTPSPGIIHALVVGT